MKKLIIIGGLILLTLICFSSCEKPVTIKSCTYSSKPPFLPAAIQDPSAEDLKFFRRDWGGDNITVTCKQVAL